jgi:hypothetical protein
MGRACQPRDASLSSSLQVPNVGTHLVDLKHEETEAIFVCRMRFEVRRAVGQVDCAEAARRALDGVHDLATPRRVAVGKSVAKLTKLIGEKDHQFCLQGTIALRLARELRQIERSPIEGYAAHSVARHGMLSRFRHHRGIVLMFEGLTRHDELVSKN